MDIIRKACEPVSLSTIIKKTPEMGEQARMECVLFLIDKLMVETKVIDTNGSGPGANFNYFLEITVCGTMNQLEV